MRSLAGWTSGTREAFGKRYESDRDAKLGRRYRLIGERSSHSWFVLKYLLSNPNVRNDDGSWTEWGNLVRTPIEK